jgi:hypothetical protein
VLQGALTDVKQPAHITIVQPVRVPALFPECLVAGLGKAEYLVLKPCPICVRNDKISHSSIIVLFVIPILVLRFIACFCLQKYDVFSIPQSNREHQGNTGNLKEKATHFIGWHLHLFALFSSFTVRLV